MRVMLFVRRASRQGHAVLDRNLETKSYVTVYLCESLFITTRLRSEVLLTTDKASIQASLLVVEGGKALVELGKNINARCVWRQATAGCSSGTGEGFRRALNTS